MHARIYHNNIQSQISEARRCLILLLCETQRNIILWSPVNYCFYDRYDQITEIQRVQYYCGRSWFPRRASRLDHEESRSHCKTSSKRNEATHTYQKAHFQQTECGCRACLFSRRQGMKSAHILCPRSPAVPAQVHKHQEVAIHRCTHAHAETRSHRINTRPVAK